MKRILLVLVLATVTATPFAAPASAHQSHRTIVQVAASDPQFSTLVGLVKKAGLADTLSKGSFTVFAPTNAAFAKVPKATLAALAANPDQLRAVLTYHVAKGRLTARKVVRRTRIRTVNGASIRVSGLVMAAVIDPMSTRHPPSPFTRTSARSRVGPAPGEDQSWGTRTVPHS